MIEPRPGRPGPPTSGGRRHPLYAIGVNLSPSEIRVLGCLLEKQRTTPDQYPLTLNGLRLACNQSTNRDPVVEYDDDVLRDALHRLAGRGYVRLASGAGSRAAKYRHLLAEALPMGEDEQAVMCVLMLRGAQTPGELKQRAERMHPFADLGAVHDTLEQLIGRGLVERLPRRPGQKEERYAQLLEDREADSAAEAGAAGLSAGGGAGVGEAGVAEVAGLDVAEGAGVSVAGAPAVGARASAEPAETAHTDPMGGATSIPSTLAALEERVARLERELLELRAAGAGEHGHPERSAERANGVSERPNGNSEPPVGVSQS